MSQPKTAHTKPQLPISKSPPCNDPLPDDSGYIYAQKLLQWYDRHHRMLPWRVTPAEQLSGQTADPYRIWLSEVMLQQTTVEAVKAYFLKFTAQWPDIQALADASEDDVLRGWAGLGYYSRARNLKKCADMVVAIHNGQFPASVEALRQLPGIGDYTSAAIAAIAFDIPAAVVDGNVERVVSRLFAIGTVLPAAKPQIRSETQKITPQNRSGDFAQAMMDLGSAICTPKKPVCSLCPLNQHCAAFAEGNPEIYPVKAPKKIRPVRYGAAFISLSPEGQVYLRKRDDKGLLGGMSEVPNSVWLAVAADAPDHAKTVAQLTSSSHAPVAADWQHSGDIIHIFTHFELRLAVYHATVTSMPLSNNGWWVATKELHREALPTVMKKAISAALPQTFQKHK